jgi:hypothetical protein
MARKKLSSKANKQDIRLAKIIEQNIHTIVNIRQATANKRTREERLADVIRAYVFCLLPYRLVCNMDFDQPGILWPQTI